MSDWPTQQDDYQVVQVTSSMSPYALNAGVDYLLVVDTSGGNVQVSLPPASGGRRKIDVKVINATNSVTVVPNGGDTIDSINADDILRDQAQTYADYAMGAWVKL